MLLQLFVALILLALLVWAVPQILAALSVPAPIARIVYVFLVVFVVLWLLSVFVGFGPRSMWSGPLLR